METNKERELEEYLYKNLYIELKDFEKANKEIVDKEHYDELRKMLQRAEVYAEIIEEMKQRPELKNILHLIMVSLEEVKSEKYLTDLREKEIYDKIGYSIAKLVDTLELQVINSSGNQIEVNANYDREKFVALFSEIRVELDTQRRSDDN